MRGDNFAAAFGKLRSGPNATGEERGSRREMIAETTEVNELLEKYDVPGPRYTSYPTVLYWDRNPTEGEWVESVARALDESEREGEGAALYIHIPFCRSLCTYCGCNSRITCNTSVGLPYVENVLREWSLYRE